MEQELHKSIKNALNTAGGLKLVPPVCSGALEGSRTGARTGGAIEFADYRSYREGDELRRIDWRLYARSEQLMVRRFAQETDPRCDIILDCSRSMDFYGKKAAAAGLGAIFAQCALNGGFSLQVWGVHDILFKMNAPGEPELWEFPERGSVKENTHPFEELRQGLFRNGVRILISDLFFDLSPVELLRFLGGGNIIVIQILGEEEIAPSLAGPVTVTDPESGQSKVIRADAESLERYRSRLTSFQKRYAEVLKNNDSSAFFLSAKNCLEQWDMEPFCREGVLQ